MQPARELNKIMTGVCQPGGYVMTVKPTYTELERRITQLETEVLEYVQKEKQFNRERKLREYSHMKRTISLMRINEELNRELRERKHAHEEEADQVSRRLKERINELNCLYDMSCFREDADFSLDDTLQTIVDFIPLGCLHPESTGARILFHGYEFATNNFEDTKSKISREITVSNERIGTLEVCRLREKPESDAEPFLQEEKALVSAIAASAARIVKREWAAAEIRKQRDHIEELLKQGKRSSATNDESPD